MTKKEEILKTYAKLGKKLGHHPSRADLVDAGVSRDRIRAHFGSFEKLKEASGVNLPERAIEPEPRVLFLDVETSPYIAKVWGLYGIDAIGINQMVKDRSVIAWAAKWLGEDEMMYQDARKARDLRRDKKLLKQIRDLMDEADIVITQNGDRFDIRVLNARFEVNGIRKPSSFQRADTKKICKKHFDFPSYSLAYLCKVFNLPHQKTEHKKFPGMELWNACEAGNPEAWEEMEKYNKMDVLALESLYKRVRHWDDVSTTSTDEKCTCGAGRTVKNGFKYNKSRTRKAQRWVCGACGKETVDSKTVPTGKKRK